MLIAQSRVGGALRRFETFLSSEQADRLSMFRCDAPASLVAQEVERKWCPTLSSHLEVLALFEASAKKSLFIQPGYLSAGRDEARVRNKSGEYLLTLKSSGGLARMEIEVVLNQSQFNDLWPGTDGRRLEKTRSILMLESSSNEASIVEVDRFYGSCSPLVLVEMEFSSIQRAGEFIAPSFFGTEVTEDSRYKNKSLACAGPPEGDLLALSSLSSPRVR